MSPSIRVHALRASFLLSGAKQSERILRAADRHQVRTVDDFLQYGEETKLRRLQRKQILDELESRELTFTPQLSRASIMLQNKARREGRTTYECIRPKVPLCVVSLLLFFR